jgi:hypothetical protein
VRDLPVTQAAPQTAAKKPDAPKPQAKVTLPAVTGTGGRIGGQLRATGQNLAMGGLAAGLDKAVRGGADARSLGATAFGRENDPTDPANISKLYGKALGGSGAASRGAELAPGDLAKRLTGDSVTRTATPQQEGRLKALGEVMRDEKGREVPQAEIDKQLRAKEPITAWTHVRRLLGMK